MASNDEIAAAASEYIARKGYVCGQHYAAVPELARALQGMVMGETQQSLEKKIREISAASDYWLEANGEEIHVAELSSTEGALTEQDEASQVSLK